MWPRYMDGDSCGVVTLPCENKIPLEVCMLREPRHEGFRAFNYTLYYSVRREQLDSI